MLLSKINSSKFFLFAISPFLFSYSYILISNYTYGDQTSYRALYESLRYANFSEVLETAKYHINASEWLTFYILWIPAVINIDKDLFIACANFLLLSLLFFVLRKYRASHTLIFLAFFNFYVIVLMTGAERLKFSIIFLLLAELMRNQKLKYLFAILSIFTHLQTILFFVAIFTGKYSQTLIEAIRTKRLPTKDIIFFIFGVLFFLAFLSNQSDGIESKANSYLGAGLKILEMLQISLILIAGIFILKNKIYFSFSILPLAISVLLIGGQRINMIAVMVFIYLFLNEKKQKHIILTAVMFYFFIKSIPFVQNIFEHGNGFHGI